MYIALVKFELIISQLVQNYIFSGIHIYPLFGNQSCHEDPLAKLKRELEKAEEEIREVERIKIKVPSKYVLVAWFSVYDIK